MAFDEQRAESRADDRLLIFSDAVIAIAITLLALDLPLPAGHTMSQFWASVRSSEGRYLAFVISFAIIAAAWSHHREVFRYVDRIDSRLRLINLSWLALIVLIPFAAKLLTIEGGDANGPHAVRFAFYSLVQALSSGLLLVMVHYIKSRKLQPGDAPSLAGTDADWQSYGLLFGFGLSIPVFFITSYAWVSWIAGPVISAQLRRRYKRRRRAASP